MRASVRCNRWSRRREGGFALIALLALAALMSAWLIASALTRTSAELSNDRERNSMDALRQAKAALIAYAASEQWQAYKGQVTNQPGALPCPDNNDNGTANCTLPNTTSLIGRLPWATMGIEDLRDASGERLWYALSANFRKASGTTIINSDTQACNTQACIPGQSQLTVIGTAPASNVVAIVFAPGAAIQGQNRPASTTDPAHNNLANYLEGYNLGDGVHYTFTTSALPSDTFNDRLIVITQADLMAAVEPAVAARIERDIKPYLQTYFTQWGAFPFPAKFANPDPGTSGTGTTRAQSAYAGDSTQTSGLLPITASLAYPWTAGSGAATLTGGIVGSISGLSCNTVALPGWQCSFSINSVDLGWNPANWGLCTDGFGTSWRYCVVNPVFTVQGTVANAGTSFANLPNVTAVTVTNSVGTPRTMSSTAINGTLATTGDGTVIFQGTWASSRYSGSAFSRSMVVTIPDVVVSTLTSAADATAGWLIANEWYRQIYYAVSIGWLPGYGGSCPSSAPIHPSGPPPYPCLTVNNMPAYYATPNTNKRAILVFAGRALDGSARPSSSLGSYLENQNSTPADFIYEHRQGVPTSINDRVVVVSP